MPATAHTQTVRGRLPGLQSPNSAPQNPRTPTPILRSSLPGFLMDKPWRRGSRAGCFLAWLEVGLDGLGPRVLSQRNQRKLGSAKRGDFIYLFICLFLPVPITYGCSQARNRTHIHGGDNTGSLTCCTPRELQGGTSL